MKRSNNWLAAAATIGLALSLVGCGGGEEAAEEANPEAAAADAPMPGMVDPVAHVPDPGMVRQGAAQGAPAAAPAPPPQPAGPVTANSAATDELLQFAQASTNPAPATPAGAVPGGYYPGEAMPGDQVQPGLTDFGPGGSFQTAPPPDLGSVPGVDPAAQLARSSGGLPGDDQVPPGAGGQFGFGPEAMPGGDFTGLGAGGLAEYKGPDFSDPIKGAQTFLAAVRAKDPVLLANAVALRSPMEAEARHRPLFQAMLDRSITPEQIDELASMLDQFEIIGTNNVRRAGELGVILGREDERGRPLTMVLSVRRERAGWKVRDFSAIRGLSAADVKKRAAGR